MLMNTKLACTERNNMLYFSIMISNRQIINIFHSSTQIGNLYLFISPYLLKLLTKQLSDTV